MDTRHFVLGLGAGLIAATLAFAAGDALSVKTVPQPSPQGTAGQAEGNGGTEADWREAAKQAGLVLLSQAELDQKLAAAKAEGEAKQPETAEPDSVFVYILPGMGTNDVARLLQAAGVVEDGNRLIDLRSRQENPIRAGMYELKLKMDPAEVLKQIATPPSG